MKRLARSRLSDKHCYKCDTLLVSNTIRFINGGMHECVACPTKLKGNIMSETEHHIGKLKPTGQSVDDYVKDCNIPSYYDSNQEYFDDVFAEKAYAISGIVYEVETKNVEDEDIAIANRNDDGSIDFQLKFYNGGCSFNEALDDALAK